MKSSARTFSIRALTAFVILCSLLLGPSPAPDVMGVQEWRAHPPVLEAFHPVETLTYAVSWSKILTAGTAVMQVRAEPLPDGREGMVLLLAGRTTGILDKVYPVRDLVRSVFDPLTLRSHSYSLVESYGRKKRLRTLVFDHGRNTVVFTQDNEPPRTLTVPEGVQDALSALYYLRTRKVFTADKPIVIDVHDSGKNWSIEVHTLGREKVKTPAGEFETIKIKTRPLYEGVFTGKGEAFFWLTDDERKVPVLMKSIIKVGSFVFTLKDVRPR